VGGTWPASANEKSRLIIIDEGTFFRLSRIGITPQSQRFQTFGQRWNAARNCDLQFNISGARSDTPARSGDGCAVKSLTEAWRPQ
jgi:hypothetical protein